ncbi:hypothetical protein B0H16DRAFT_1455077 [Mycena metata]|uniref:Uncharacterized protein n=1 Tax=Mycena metata TaxID=1033252 RepID=A0AAD7NK67_9AGAR|nr:hypothetical protein B0H16DRAFT_1455077 [Mycena metata]
MAPEASLARWIETRDGKSHFVPAIIILVRTGGYHFLTSGLIYPEVESTLAYTNVRQWMLVDTGGHQGMLCDGRQDKIMFLVKTGKIYSSVTISTLHALFLTEKAAIARILPTGDYRRHPLDSSAVDIALAATRTARVPRLPKTKYGDPWSSNCPESSIFIRVCQNCGLQLAGRGGGGETGLKVFNSGRQDSGREETEYSPPQRKISEIVWTTCARFNVGELGSSENHRLELDFYFREELPL